MSMWNRKSRGWARMFSRLRKLLSSSLTFNEVIKALKYKDLHMDDARAIAEGCPDCLLVGASVSGTARAQYRDKELTDISFIGHTASMADIDSRTVVQGRYFTDGEDQRSAYVCLIGDDLVAAAFRRRERPGTDNPAGQPGVHGGGHHGPHRLRAGTGSGQLS